MRVFGEVEVVAERLQGERPPSNATIAELDDLANEQEAQ